jgi:hypothetical protein
MQALLLEGFFVNLLLSIQDEEKGPNVLEKMGLPRSLFRRELARSLSTRKSLSPEKNPKCIMVNSLW